MKKIDHDYVSAEAIAVEDEAGELQYVTDNQRIPTKNYFLDVSRGKIAGTQLIASYGERLTTGAETDRVVWPNGVFSIPDAAGVQMSLVSTSADDDETGTNIRTVELHYLDADLNEQSEIITLQGLTPVLTVATNIRFINCMHLHTFGTIAKAAGDIIASNGGTTYSQISTGKIRCSSSARMVPAGKKCFVAGAVGGATSPTADAAVLLHLVANELDSNQYSDPFVLFPQSGIGLQNSPATFNFPLPIPFSAGTVIAFKGTTDKTARISASWYGWLENV